MLKTPSVVLHFKFRENLCVGEMSFESFLMDSIAVDFTTQMESTSRQHRPHIVSHTHQQGSSSFNIACQQAKRAGRNDMEAPSR